MKKKTAKELKVAGLCFLILMISTIYLANPAFGCYNPKKSKHKPHHYWPISHYETRRKDYLEFYYNNPSDSPHSACAEIEYCLLKGCNTIINTSRIQYSLDRMNNRWDCADFGLNGILRLLYQYQDSGMLTPELISASEEAILNFKYWPDELADNADPDSMCYWTENHFILYASAGYLAGQLYPNEYFQAADHIGMDKMDIMRSRIIRWLNLRYLTGFSEWLSNVYYDESLAAVLNLVDFCQDGEIVKKARMVADLMLLDIALNHFRGYLGSTHGRTKLSVHSNHENEATAPLCTLVFGINEFKRASMCTTNLACSKNYRIPSVIYNIGTDTKRPEIINKQRMGIKVEEAEQWGLDYNTLGDGMTFLTLEAYNHPQTIELFIEMLDEYNWWENQFFFMYSELRPMIEYLRAYGLLPAFAQQEEWDLTRNMRPEVNIYTYRTPDYMLSSAQDYRKAYGGDQQLAWQATLGADAVCFTTHPTPIPVGGDFTPNYWDGSGQLPKVAQIENLAIIEYKLNHLDAYYMPNQLFYTHAWLPKDNYDEVIEKNGWIFARKGDGYLALWSEQPYYWQTEGDYKDIEVIAESDENVWICEMGRRATNGPFWSFVNRISNSLVLRCGEYILYNSPSQGFIKYCWDNVSQNCKPVKLNDYPRYQNPYSYVNFPAGQISIYCKHQWLYLNEQTMTRFASSYL
ncbi:MAG: hypothetical protein ACFFAO_11685 [Candidatus Hermodarchaeota archaeon]